MLFPNDAVVMILARMVGMFGPFDMEMLVKGQETHKYFTKEYDIYFVNEVCCFSIIMLSYFVSFCSGRTKIVTHCLGIEVNGSLYTTVVYLNPTRRLF